MCDVIAALKLSNENDESQKFRTSSPGSNETHEGQPDNDADWIDEINDDDDSGKQTAVIFKKM